jgi:hypothetical protein
MRQNLGNLVLMAEFEAIPDYGAIERDPKLVAEAVRAEAISAAVIIAHNGYWHDPIESTELWDTTNPMEHHLAGEFLRSRRVLSAISLGNYWAVNANLLNLTDESAFDNNPGRREIGRVLLMMTTLSRIDIPHITAGRPGRSWWELDNGRRGTSEWPVPDVLTAMRKELGADEAFTNWPKGSRFGRPRFPGVSDMNITNSIIDGSLRLGGPYAE